MYPSPKRESIDVVVLEDHKPSFPSLSPIIIPSSPQSMMSPASVGKSHLAKPRSAEPISSQAEPLTSYTCPVCFGAPTNATLTPCGHIMCGSCLFAAVKATLHRSAVVAMDRAPQARCPVCRAEIPGWDGRGGGVIGLTMAAMYSV
ncbi:hypothetical protein CONPUDRAFT_135395 [Coniophora puteana RWD-64-598 SS2]|uniref:RING-type domain-containing protein n=1 Tax=Coniophora puteana (strain RWD-64-598) TaxID=741705 RepID=A0A5M3MWP6_CONPW|nr:uncharacterized protein CONPUDRAFT_135395 [Coniophora puteana RWD-64-598 SS2]EIW83569.1 hypothetical protein CONPUDRAFT_135395 [Coniophora puteana RWD-64-598 SS2]